MANAVRDVIGAFARDHIQGCDLVEVFAGVHDGKDVFSKWERTK